MRQIRLVLNNQLKHEIDEQLRTHNANTTKKLLALKLLDQSEGNVQTISEVAKLVGLSEPTITKLINSVKEGDCTLEQLLSRKKYDGKCRPVKYDGAFEARAITIACSNPPDGINRWTLKLIAEKLVEMQHYEDVSVSAVQRALSKNNLKPHRSEYWKIPPKADANFVCQMENILDTYSLPYNEKEPVICLDETTKQLLDNVVPPLPSIVNHISKVDDEYIRCGVASIFVAIEPLTRRTFISVGETRNKVDFANFLQSLSNAYPSADKIHIVLDNLNVHSVSSLYVAYTPFYANQIANRFVFHYTPKHGSWLNMAEAAIAHYKTQCLRERVPSLDELRKHTATYLHKLHISGQPFNWCFTSEQARIKLKSLYPDYVYKDETDIVYSEDKTMPKFMDSVNILSLPKESNIEIVDTTLEDVDGVHSDLCVMYQTL